MNELNKYDFVVNNFIHNETQLIECMTFIPFIENNKNVISPKFVAIITEACSLIDSIFKEITENDHRKKSLKDYSQLHEGKLTLSENKSLFLSTPIMVLQPYKEWTNKQPSWWLAYNKLKHDRLQNYTFATFINAVSSIVALHQLMSRCKVFVGGFLKAGFINTSDGDVVEQLGSAAVVGALMNNPPDLVIESQLVVSATIENFINCVSEDGRYIDINYDIPGISFRVRNFISALEDWE